MDNYVGSNYPQLVRKVSWDIHFQVLDSGKFRVKGKNVEGGYHNMVEIIQLRRKFFGILQERKWLVFSDSFIL